MVRQPDIVLYGYEIAREKNGTHTVILQLEVVCLHAWQRAGLATAGKTFAKVSL